MERKTRRSVEVYTYTTVWVRTMSALKYNSSHDSFPRANAAAQQCCPMRGQAVLHVLLLAHAVAQQGCTQREGHDRGYFNTKNAGMPGLQFVYTGTTREVGESYSVYKSNRHSTATWPAESTRTTPDLNPASPPSTRGQQPFGVSSRSRLLWRS